MTVRDSLQEAISRSNQLQDRLKTQFGDALVQWKIDRATLSHHRQKLVEIANKVLDYIREKVLTHPLLERWQETVKEAAANLSKRLRPIYLMVVKNSLLTCLIGLVAGFLVGWWLCASYKDRYYGTLSKPRPMSGVICDTFRYAGLDGISAKSNLVMPRITETNQVLVRVHAGSVDSADIAILSGMGRNERKPSQDRNLVLGRDLSGVVLEVGRKVKHVGVGDAVWSAQPIGLSGTLSEFVVVRGDSVRLRPPHLAHEGAATLPYSGLSVWDAIVKKAGFYPNRLNAKTVFIVDGGSPTGVIAIQIVKAWGGRVVTCAPYRTSHLLQLLKADRIVALSHDQDAEERCRTILDEEEAIDLVLLTSPDSSLSETFCQDYCDLVLKTYSEARLGTDGYGFFRNWMLSYWRLFSRPHHRLDTRPLDHLASLVEQKKLQPVLHAAFAFEQSEEAFQATATTATVGKTIITFGLRQKNNATSVPEPSGPKSILKKR